MQCLGRQSQALTRGFLIWEWVIALALLGSFALLVIALLQRQETYLMQQQELRQQVGLEEIQLNIAAQHADHRLLFELQEGT